MNKSFFQLQKRIGKAIPVTGCKFRRTFSTFDKEPCNIIINVHKFPHINPCCYFYQFSPTFYAYSGY